MERMLCDMRKDAIEKLKAAGEDDCILLLNSIGRLKALYDEAKAEGLPGLPSVVLGEKSQYLKMLINMLADGYEQEYVIEIGTNEYWIQNPQGVEAFVYYVYLRGIICIQEGWNISSIELLICSLVPEKWRADYYVRFGDGLDDTSHNREIEESFFNLYPVIGTEELTKKVSVLQEKVKKLDKYSFRDILFDVFWHWKTHSDELVRCLYGFDREIREKLINCIGKTSGRLLMEDTVRLMETGIGETDILKAVVYMDYIVDRAINKEG